VVIQIAVQVEWLRTKNSGLQAQLSELLVELDALERRFEECKGQQPALTSVLSGQMAASLQELTHTCEVMKQEIDLANTE